MVSHLLILQHSRDRVIRRYETILFMMLCAILGVSSMAWVNARRRDERRLQAVRTALEGLVRGQAVEGMADQRRDSVGRISAMIGETSRLFRSQRKRLDALRDLEKTQEAARRQVHEIRTPLHSVGLELSRLEGCLGADHPGREALRNAREEVERLSQLTRTFSEFARIPVPEPQPTDLSRVLREFVEKFAGVWPHLELELRDPGPLPALVDREALRQVLTNLIDNSARALGDRRGRIVIEATSGDGQVTVRVTDDGPGIDSAIVEHMFEPYVTTRPEGEGGGLGLAIAKKIMLDHRGDLLLERTSDSGTALQLFLPDASCSAS